ncbi:hydroxypyruvate isomerase family protein [Natronorubrum texcoconense]|uniref:Hydroxypyruvate isomerase n=1 Tax=Natronorubrum texcoconense TaxID=1095776 RepID=A0A1G9CQI8_9EURY|nr:TIM barrel protein [Natronorubrum texcoconense]SDK53866.1 hydroxypyruvate isomerase [Natronorubrum texcoconense]
MVDLSVCLETVYDDEPFHERVSRAADAGADAVEFWDWREKDLEAVTTAADEADLPVVGCVAGGTLTDSEQADDAAETVRESIETAAEIDCSTLIATTGPDQEGLDRETQHRNIVDVLSSVAPDAEEAGVTIVVEPLNTAVDHPGYYLTSTREGVEIVEAVDSPNVKLLYDVYHQQITEGNVIQTLTDCIEHVGHVHIADVPGRHEPGTGELNYANIIDALEESGYDGFVGCEFSPLEDPDEAMAATRELLGVER